MVWSRHNFTQNYENFHNSVHFLTRICCKYVFLSHKWRRRMGIEPTRDLLSPTLVLKTRGTTRHQSPPQTIFIYLPPPIVIHPPYPVNRLTLDIRSTPLGGNWLCFAQRVQGSLAVEGTKAQRSKDTKLLLTRHVPVCLCRSVPILTIWLCFS